MTAKQNLAVPRHRELMGALLSIQDANREIAKRLEATQVAAPQGENGEAPRDERYGKLLNDTVELRTRANKMNERLSEYGVRLTKIEAYLDRLQGR